MVAMEDKFAGNSNKEERSDRQKSVDMEQLDIIVKQCIASLEEKMTKAFQKEMDALREKNAGLESALNELKKKEQVSTKFIKGQISLKKICSYKK